MGEAGRRAEALSLAEVLGDNVTEASPAAKRR